jgi:glycosyltransferase involved in cell wall biosynthesis
MNILVVTSSAGSLNSLRPEAEMYIELSKMGHDLTLVTKLDSYYGRRYQDNGISVIDAVTVKKICFDTIRKVRNELKKKKYDIVFATNSKAIPNAAFAVIGFNVRLITYRGTTGGLYRHDPSAYLTHLHPRVDGIVCVSDAVREDVRSRVWKNTNNVVTVHKGHSLSWYTHPAADLKEFGIEDDDFTIICAVNARPSKGIPVMLEAARKLSHIENLHILLAGKNMDQYKKLIDDTGMSERIHVLGYRHDVPCLIAASDLLVQPSISGEGLPRALMEAMGCGTPAVITDTGGGKEVLEDGVTGYVVPTQDTQALADKVGFLVARPELIKKMSEACKEKIASEYSCVRSAELYADFFKKQSKL